MRAESEAEILRQVTESQARDSGTDDQDVHVVVKIIIADPYYVSVYVYETLIFQKGRRLTRGREYQTTAGLLPVVHCEGTR